MSNTTHPFLIICLLALFIGCARKETRPLEKAKNPTIAPLSHNGLAKDTYNLFHYLPEKPELADVVKKADYFKINPLELERLYREKPEQFTLLIPNTAGIPTSLVFQKSKVITPSFNFQTSDGKAHAINPGVHYRQIKKGEIMAAVSIFKDYLAGLVATADGNFNLSKLTDSDDEYILVNDKDLLDSPIDFQCPTQIPEGFELMPFKKYNQFSGEKSMDKVVRIFAETDYDAFQMTGGTVQDVYDYVTTLFNLVGMIFEAEQINIRLTEMYVWTEPDPYFPSEPLFVFLRKWADSGNNFNADLAHLLTGFSGSGLANVDVLCADDRDPAARSGITQSDFSLFPNFIPTVYIVTHEIGHNLGSLHTHSCSWGPNNDQTIDNCSSPENGNCSSGPPPVNGGTVMSYCSGFNLLNGFGPEPGDLIRAKVEAADCLKTLAEVDACTFDQVVVTAFCENDPTPNDPTDNAFTIQLNVKSGASSLNLQAKDVDSGQTWNFSSNTDFQIGPINTLAGSRTIQIIDLQNPTCLTERVIFPHPNATAPTYACLLNGT